MIKQEVNLLLENLDYLRNSVIGLCWCTVIFGSYLFQSIVLLKPDFSWWNSFALSWVNKVETGIESFVSVIVNVGTWPSIALFIIKYFADKVRIRLLLQLSNGISRVLQKLLKYFTGTLVLTSFPPLISVLSPI